MIPDIGFWELLVIGAIALIVVGPRDLPQLLRNAGRVVRTARGMAREFRASFDDMAKEVELDSLKKEFDVTADEEPKTNLSPTGSETEEFDLEDPYGSDDDEDDDDGALAASDDGDDKEKQAVNGSGEPADPMPERRIGLVGQADRN